jgi:hypothetical protein
MGMNASCPGLLEFGRETRADPAQRVEYAPTAEFNRALFQLRAARWLVTLAALAAFALRWLIR